MNTRRRHMFFIVVLLGIWALMGCVPSHEGRIVPQQNRIALKAGGPHQGAWIRNHATFDFVYTRTPGQLGLSGNLSITGLRYRLTSFTFWLHFLDADGKIIRNQALFSTSQMKSVTMNHNLNLPAGTTAISFSYSGVQGERGIQIEFQSFPFTLED